MGLKEALGQLAAIADEAVGGDAAAEMMTQAVRLGLIELTANGPRATPEGLYIAVVISAVELEGDRQTAVTTALGERLGQRIITDATGKRKQGGIMERLHAAIDEANRIARG